MKKISFIILIVLILSSCATDRTLSIEKKPYFDKISTDAMDLIDKGDYEKAKNLLLEGILDNKPDKLPHYEKEPYGVVINNGNTPDIFRKFVDDYNKDMYLFLTVESYQKLYCLMGIVFIDEKNYDKAIPYIDTCLYIWNGYALAWFDLVYAYSTKGDNKKAKELGDSALKIPKVLKDKPRAAAILRQLGAIAVEENDFEKAGEYYKKSLEYDDSEKAIEEIKHIQDSKEKK